jgi:hypothetical protein
MPKKTKRSSHKNGHKRAKSGGRKRATTTQVTFRIEKDWLGRADRVASKLSSDGVEMTRTDGFRAVMAAGFKLLERRR